MHHLPERNEAPPYQLPERHERLPNSFITLRVEEAFAADSALLGTRIAVETFEGIVQLTGVARWQYQLSWAKHVAWGVGGVSGIRSYIRLAQSVKLPLAVGAEPRTADSRGPCLAELVDQDPGFEDGKGPQPPACFAGA